MIPVPVTGTVGVVIAAAALLTTHGSPASVGAGIQAAPVRIAAVPGTASSVSVTVMNTGSGTETLWVRAYQLDPASHRVPASWARAASVTLTAGTEGACRVTVTIPAGTAPGRYRSDILATPVVLQAGTPLSFGAAALTDLVVTVTPSATSAH